MKECMINNELTLRIVDLGTVPAALIQFIDKRGTIGVKIYNGSSRWYL